MIRSLFILVLTVSALGGCTTADILDCRAANGLTPDCRFENPEDFAVSTTPAALIISEMGRGGLTSRQGRLVAYYPDAAGAGRGESRILWPRGSGGNPVAAAPAAANARAAGAALGDPACKALSEGDWLVPHGIDLSS